MDGEMTPKHSPGKWKWNTGLWSGSVFRPSQEQPLCGAELDERLIALGHLRQEVEEVVRDEAGGTQGVRPKVSCIFE